jgi:Ca-activated chloride channel homolog
MKYIRLYFLPVLGLLALSAPLLLAQVNYAPVGNAFASGNPAITSTASGADDPVLTVKKQVNEVNVLFIATDKHGKFVRNLNENDFAILDDHKPPQAIVNFSSQTDLPLELGLLIDTSGSVRTRFDFEQDSAVAFLQQTLRPHFDKAFVMGFNSHETITQDFTDDNVLLRIGVHRLQNGGGTALYDAVYRACRTKLMKDHDQRPARRAIIIISDGEDNQSEVTEGQAIEMAQRAQVIIYTISTDDSGLILRGDTVLQQLADATGGRAFFPYKMKDVKSSFAAIENELRSQYVVSYHPADFEADGRYRPIEITAVRKDLQVRARKGYYAPTQ